MFAKTLTVALASSALFASVALAQTQTPAQSPSTSTSTSTSPAATATGTTISSSQLQGDWRASKVVGLNVYNDKNEKVGSINDLIMDKSGSIKAAILGVGGFLGMGEHLVAVSFDKLKFSNEAVSYTTTSSNSPNPAPATGPVTARPSTTTGASTATTTTKSNPWYPDHAVFNATKDELKAMPEFKYE